MNPSYWIPIILLLIILLLYERNKKLVLKKQLQKKKSREERAEMLELAKKFLEKECIVYTFNSQVEGVIKEVAEGGILLEKNGTQEVINLDFIVRIREFPKKKNGKKKSVVLD